VFLIRATYSASQWRRFGAQLIRMNGCEMAALNRLAIFRDSRSGPDQFWRQLSDIFQIELKRFDDIGREPPGEYTVFDFDLNAVPRLTALKEWLKAAPSGAKVIFVTDKGSRLQDTQAYAIGATELLHRPLDARAVLTTLWGDVASLSADPANIAIRKSPGAAAAVTTLQSIFSAACLGEPLESRAVQAAGEAVVGQVEAQGLTAWIDTVRTHHSQTYQHCLLVTGLAVAFGQQIGASSADRQRLAFAGMLHDIGKARIPLAILEKPGRLDDEEMGVMKKHPQYGFDALETVRGLPTGMLDMVVHHHEYLDGSGYPHGLQAHEISDLVRIITISDVFGALIERRSYKPPLSGDAAYQILLDMGPKLDRDLVREFQFAAKLGGDAMIGQGQKQKIA
jgi:putative nucleotidyltransferase with HDIG domain